MNPRAPPDIPPARPATQDFGPIDAWRFYDASAAARTAIRFAAGPRLTAASNIALAINAPDDSVRTPRCRGDL